MESSNGAAIQVNAQLFDAARLCRQNIIQGMARGSEGQMLSKAEEGAHMGHGPFKEDSPAGALLLTTTIAAAVVGREVLSILSVPWRRHFEPKSEVLALRACVKVPGGGTKKEGEERGEEFENRMRLNLFYARLLAIWERSTRPKNDSGRKGGKGRGLVNGEIYNKMRPRSTSVCVEQNDRGGGNSQATLCGLKETCIRFGVRFVPSSREAEHKPRGPN